MAVRALQAGRGWILQEQWSWPEAAKGQGESTASPKIPTSCNPLWLLSKQITEQKLVEWMGEGNKGVTLPDSFRRSAFLPSPRRYSAGMVKNPTAYFCAWCLYVGISMSFATHRHIAFAFNPYPVFKETVTLLGRVESGRRAASRRRVSPGEPGWPRWR